jgi:hypothetical protein
MEDIIKQISTVETNEKMKIVKELIENDFRCRHDDEGYHTMRDTNSILMSMHISVLQRIRTEYQPVINKKGQIRNSIKPLYNEVMKITGLAHFTGLLKK